MNKQSKDGKYSLFNLEGKTVLVTGANGQLGSVICDGFLNSGSIVIGADLKPDQGKVIEDKNISYFTVDIASQESVENLFSLLLDKYHSIDILINNVGVGTFDPYKNRTEKSFDCVSDINLKGTFFCIQQYINHQNNLNRGNIVNIASVYGLISPDPRIYKEGDRKSSEIYGATKAGIIQMTKYFAINLAEMNIRVNAVSPGGIFNTERPQSDYFITEYSKRNPMGRMANVEEILGAIIYLASDASSYVTGHNLVVDGGMSCW